MPPKRGSRTNSDEHTDKDKSSRRPTSTRKQPERAKNKQPGVSSSASPETETLTELEQPSSTAAGEGESSNGAMKKESGNTGDQVENMDLSPDGAGTASAPVPPSTNNNPIESFLIDPALGPTPTSAERQSRKRSASDVPGGGGSAAPSTPGPGETSADLLNPGSAASKRREANRLAAARFRTRKKDQVAELEGRVATLEAENIGLKAEVQALRLVAASKNANGEVPSYKSLLEDVLAGRVPMDEFGEPLALGGKKRRKTGDPEKDKEIDRMIEEERKQAEEEKKAEAEKKRMEEAIAESVRIGGKILLEEENGRLKQEVQKYESQLGAMHKEIEDLRFKVEMQNGGAGVGVGGPSRYAMMDVDPYPSNPYEQPRFPMSYAQASPSSSRPDFSATRSSAAPYNSYGQSSDQGYGTRGPVMASSSQQSVRSGQGREGSAGLGSGSRSNRNNWSLNLSNLPGSASSPLAISSMRGMDSPVSAERSGARGEDEEMDGGGADGGSGGPGQGYFSNRA